MARYDRTHKEATHARILETAAVRLKQDGIDGAGVATLMKDAGLTNGAFYAHFDSKELLVAEVVSSELAGQLARFSAIDLDGAGLEVLVRGYLCEAHRDDPGRGCPSAALVGEIARRSPGVREAWTDGMLAVVDDLAGRLGSTGDEGRVRVLSACALMVGTIQLARALTDDDLSHRLIERGVAQVLDMLRAPR